MIFIQLKMLSHIMCRSIIPNFIQIRQSVESTDKLIYTPKLDMSSTAPILTELNTLKICLVDISTKLIS